MKNIKNWKTFNENRELDYDKNMKNNEISEKQSKLENYKPIHFEYDDYILDSQSENAGIIDTSVWIEFVSNNPIDNIDIDELKNHFFDNTDFDEVEIETTENSVSFVINIYDYENR